MTGLHYARPRPWETAYRRVPDAAVSSERIAAAREGAARASELMGEPAPAIRWFEAVDWRAGYDFTVDGKSNGFATYGEPGRINLNAGLTMAETAHVAAHEWAHLVQFEEGPPTAANHAPREREAEAYARGICEAMRNSCNRCQLTGNRPLDFIALLRKREAEALRPPAQPSASRAATTPKNVIVSVGHLRGVNLYNALIQAAGSGWEVCLGPGRYADGAAALAAYEKARAAEKAKPPAAGQQRSAAPTPWLAPPAFRTLRPSALALRHAGEMLA